MEWEFRKILQSTENYRAGSPRFMAMIEKNTPGALKTIVREIELIMADPNANIFSKVLAVRFARDIMILGRQDVINELTRLVPHMLKICSYKLESDDPNRGESFFYSHPQYNSTNVETIESYGSTYFILNLESMYHWGNWIKVDESGNQSIYSKGLNSLIERGVKFPTNFNYYKNSDTEKFKNTYRVQFFPEQSVDLDSSRHSNVKSDRQSPNTSQVQYKEAQNVEAIKNNLQAIQMANPRRFDKLDQMKKSAIALLQRRYHPSMIYYGKEKTDKKWLEDFIINNNLLAEKKISFEEFLKRSTSYTIQIPEKTEFEPSMQELGETKNGFKKSKSSVKRQPLSKSPMDERPSYDQLLKQQQETHHQIVSKYKLELRQLNDFIQQERVKHEQQKNALAQGYEDRIRNMKMEIGQANSGRNEVIIKENQKLKEKLYDLERSMAVSREREVEANQAVVAYDILKVENQNLKRLQMRKPDEVINPQERLELTERIRKLQNELQNARNENQILLSKMPGQRDLAKKDKQVSQLTDELVLYKNSLKSQRESFQKKYKQLEARLKESEDEVKDLKEKYKTVQKKLDLRDIEAVEMSEQVKLFKALGSEEKFARSRTNVNLNMRDGISQKNSRSNQKYLAVGTEKPRDRQQRPSTISYNFKKYEAFRNKIFQSQKQRFLRFCRCSLKKKDLLLKQNQLQIGLISQPISNNEVKYLVHLTNMSEYQMNQIRLYCEAGNPADQVRLENQYIFCLQTNQQEKIGLLCRAGDNFIGDLYEPIFLVICFVKNQRSYETRVAIPFLLFKTLQLYKVDKNLQTDLHNQHTLTFPYSHKMISDTKHLYSYFPPIQQTVKNKYEFDCLYRETGSRFRIQLQLKEDKMTVVLSPIGQSKADPKQQQIIEYDLMSFLEFCFRK